MKIKRKEITVGELVEGYIDDGEGGVRGYGGRLDIRPPYQREFVYKEKQRAAVIDTVMNEYPLNVMYWATRSDGTYEIIDGQQRTISLAQYVNSDFSFNMRFFHNLNHDEAEKVRGYELMVYVCDGTDSEKLKWFETINIAGEKLTKQELRNAVYAGSWVSDAKRYFSRHGQGADRIAGRYLRGSVIRQEFLETAIDWISDGTIEQYMATHQHDSTATDLWSHFRNVIDRVEALFPDYRREMKGVDWGGLHPHMKDNSLDPKELEERVEQLMMDSEVQKKSGIYPYVLTGKEKHLNLRVFPDDIKRSVYEQQGGRCKITGDEMPMEEMEADHITPWSKGGKTVEENCQMISKEENRKKGAK